MLYLSNMMDEPACYPQEHLGLVWFCKAVSSCCVLPFQYIIFLAAVLFSTDMYMKQK
jgi:hypothetical protein